MTAAGPRIHILEESVSRKIAAGEVVERPQAVLRELLDNSIDAGAGQIDVELGEGGNAMVRVVDDGCGMSREELALCVQSHATSKITTERDLQRITTLGFRGEALSSIGAVSRLTITSGTAGSIHTVRVENGVPTQVQRTAGRPGTVVEVADIFYNLPARKRFLKRANTEGSLCAAVFRDKALGFPDIQFRLSAGGQLRMFLPQGSRTERIAAAYAERTEPALLHELRGSGDGFAVHLVAGEPGAYRRDRKQLQVFVNSRRVWEYALVQAVEYAYSDYLHGGLHPVVYLFLEVDPEGVDVNVHPAKREVRLRNLGAIHKRVVEILSEFLRVFSTHTTNGVTGGPGFESFAEPASTSLPARRAAYDLSRVLDVAVAAEPTATIGTPEGVALSANDHAETEAELDYRYLGQLLSLFLVVERPDGLYLIDQHAAHERIIYDRLTNGFEGQELLFPVHLELDKEQQSLLAEHSEMLAGLGIRVECSDGICELMTFPSALDIEAEEIAWMLMEGLERPKDFARELYAALACHAAITDGDQISDATAHAIIQAVLPMENARCPHGRPVWICFSREELFRLVGRS
jgi:DNA mismatch repair protein MutL